MSLRKVKLDAKKQKAWMERNQNRQYQYQPMNRKNHVIPKADMEMLVLDRYEKEREQ